MTPRLIHRPWLGPATPPAAFDYTEAWKATNPDLTLLTWTDQTVENLFPLVLQAEYNAAPTYVHRADIIMLESVYRHGGCAVGYDMEPLRSVSEFAGDTDCWCTPDADGFAGGAFFGATWKHPTIRYLLDTIHFRIKRDGWHDTRPDLDTGPWAWGEAFGRHHENALEHGMHVLGDWQTAYPVRYWEKQLFENPYTYAHRTRHSVVVHHFAGSWLTTDVKVRREDP